MGRLRLKLPGEEGPWDSPGRQGGTAASAPSLYLRWMKSVPAPAVVDLSEEFALAAAAAAPGGSNNNNIVPPSRLRCRLLLLPSGSEMQETTTSPEREGALVYGKLLYGGGVAVTTTRQKRRRRAAGGDEGPRTTAELVGSRGCARYGGVGGQTRYEAADGGACAVLEVALLPPPADGNRGETSKGGNNNNNNNNFDKRSSSSSSNNNNSVMLLRGFAWDPNDMFEFDDAVREDGTDRDGDCRDRADSNAPSSSSPPSASSSSAGRSRSLALKAALSWKAGGLRPQVDAIVRRVLDGRLTTSASSDPDQEAEALALMGLAPVKGLLLHGPPGCGKTVLAREISRALGGRRRPKIVAAPELLDRWVGGSEKKVRELFADAEAELAACQGGDHTKSELHVIVVDEIDAVFRKRSDAEDSGEATRSSVVNQILAKLDGVNAIPNVLFVGLTNRRELLDEALLRPGRLEVQVEVGLPDASGRREILQIHFEALRRRGRLSEPLCRAIDGVAAEATSATNSSAMKGAFISSGKNSADAPAVSRAASSRRSSLKGAIGKAFRMIPLASRRLGRGRSYHYDLAADYATGGFTGADLAGLVRCAGSIALARARKEGTGVGGLLVTLEDAQRAPAEVKR